MGDRSRYHEIKSVAEALRWLSNETDYSLADFGGDIGIGLTMCERGGCWGVFAPGVLEELRGRELITVHGGLTEHGFRVRSLGGYFTREMVEAIRTMLYWTGGAFCPKCHEQEFVGGTGRVGDPDCVVRCAGCGWRPRSDGLVREHGSRAVDCIEALLPPEVT